MKKILVTTMIIILAFAQGFSQLKKGNSGESKGNDESVYNEEMKISKKYLNKGIILTSFGASTIIAGAVLINEYNSSKSYTYNSFGAKERDNTFLIAGILSFAASIPFDIIGPIMFSKSAKHRKLAREANPDMTFKPVILPSGTSYAMGVGVKIRL